MEKRKYTRTKLKNLPALEEYRKGVHMLSKEEIEYIEQIEKAIENNENFYWQEDMYELIEIIKKQHGREQKLIQKLEKILKEYENIIANEESAMSLYAEILEIVKGVENERDKIN